MRITMILSIFISILLSCNTGKSDGNTVITGKAEGLTDQKIYLEELSVQQVNLIDSAQVGADGAFKFTIDLKEPSFYRLRLQDNRFITLILAPEDKVNVTASAAGFDEQYTVTGSPGSAELKEINTYMKKSMSDVNRLDEIYREKLNDPSVNKDSLRSTLQGQYATMMEEREKYLKNFIEKNDGSFSLLAAVTYLTPEKDFNLMKKAQQSLSKNYPNSVYVSDFAARVKDLEKLAPGSEAPEIILENPAGEKIALSSLRGKYVLIDFWAAWCGPCRMENPNLVKVYNKFKEKGFEIYGVSLDNTKQAWEGAISADNLTWVHVSDLMRWNSPVVKLYNIEGIPYSYLLDREGKIIDKGLRSEALEQRLTQLLQ